MHIHYSKYKFWEGREGVTSLLVARGAWLRTAAHVLLQLVHLLYSALQPTIISCCMLPLECNINYVELLKCYSPL